MASTKDKVLRLRKEHPLWTLEEIGREAKVTRERVRQILKQYGEVTRVYPRRWQGESASDARIRNTGRLVYEHPGEYFNKRNLNKEVTE